VIYTNTLSFSCVRFLFLLLCRRVNRCISPCLSLLLSFSLDLILGALITRLTYSCVSGFFKLLNRTDFFRVIVFSFFCFS